MDPKTGAPSDYFLRQWQGLTGAVADIAAAQAAITAIQAFPLVTLGAVTDLTAERRITAGTAIGIADGGANSTVTISVNDPELTAIAGLTSAADKVPYFTGSGTAALADFTSFGRSLVDDGNATVARATLGLGNISTINLDGNGSHVLLGNGTWGTSGVSTTLTSSHILVGNATNVATDVAMSGDATLANTGAITIANDAVSYAKMQNVSAASKLLGRGDSGSGDPQEITLGTGLTMTGTTLSSSGGISTTLTSAHILVGNATNVATDVAASGDVTLANTGAFTIANDAVTFAKFQNITDARLLGRSAGSSGDMQELTVSTGLSLTAGVLTATGGGTGGVGALYPSFTTPVDGDYAWINQGGATTTVNANGGIFLLAPAGAGVNVRIRKKAAPGATPYTVTIAAFYNILNVNFQYAGIIFRQSSDGKFINYQMEGDSGKTAFIAGKYNSPTSFNTAAGTVTANTVAGVVWFRVTDDGTNRKFYYSTDGYNFTLIFSEGRTVFLTADEIGFGCATETASYDAGMTLLSWLVT